MDAGHSVIPDGALLVDGEQIVAVGPAATSTAAATPRHRDQAARAAAC